MEWIVRRVCDRGKVIKDHQQVHNKAVRGEIKVADAHDEARRRQVRQALLIPSFGEQSIPPLHDVQLLASVGGYWSLAGYERLGTDTGDEQAFAQTWLLTPAQNEDLQFLEAQVVRLSKLLEAHHIDPEVRWSEWHLEKAERARKRRP